VLSIEDVRRLLALADELDRPRFKRDMFRALLLILYCTGLRFGEAVRLRVADVDTRKRTIFVRETKRRSRCIPFDATLAESCGATFALVRRSPRKSRAISSSWASITGNACPPPQHR
jgi:integrase